MSSGYILLFALWAVGVLLHLEKYEEENGDRYDLDYIMSLLWPIKFVLYWVGYRMILVGVRKARGKLVRRIVSYWRF